MAEVNEEQLIPVDVRQAGRNHAMHRSGGGLRFLKSNSTPATR